MTTKLPPHSEEAERGVLGSVLCDSRRAIGIICERAVMPQMLYLTSHELIMQAMLEMASEDAHIDLLTVAIRLKDMGELEKIGGHVYLESLLDDTPTSAALDYYLDIVVEKWRKRQVLEAAGHMIEGVRRELDAKDVASKITVRLLELTKEQATTETPDQQLERAEREWVEAEAGNAPGVPSIWMPVENMLASYRPKECIVWGARPSCGKTIIMCNEAEGAASRGVPVGIYSLEMPEESLRKRMACARARTSTFRLMRGHATTDERERAVAEWKKLNRLPLYICDRRTTIDNIEGWMTYAFEKWGIKVFWLDYLTMIEDSTSGKGDWVRVVGEFCARIKERGKRLGITTNILAQFSRTGNKLESEDTPPAPTLEALRDSGEVEQHADTVVLVYKRPSLPNDQFSSDNDWPMEWNFAKNRNGPTGRLPMVMVRKEQRYVTQNEADERKRKSENKVDRNHAQEVD